MLNISLDYQLITSCFIKGMINTVYYSFVYELANLHDLIGNSNWCIFEIPSYLDWCSSHEGIGFSSRHFPWSNQNWIYHQCQVGFNFHSRNQKIFFLRFRTLQIWCDIIVIYCKKRLLQIWTTLDSQYLAQHL